MKLFRLALALLAVVAAGAIAADDIPASAPWCSLPEPPADAGETAVRGALVKLAPRRSQMKRPYDGCQIAWMRHQNRWLRVSVMYFESGELRRWWKPDLDAPARGIVCSYADGRLTPGAHPQCHVPSPEVVPGVSYAPGCIEEALRTGRLTSSCAASLDRGR